MSPEHVHEPPRKLETNVRSQLLVVVFDGMASGAAFG